MMQERPLRGVPVTKEKSKEFVLWFREIGIGDPLFPIRTTF